MYMCTANMWSQGLCDKVNVAHVQRIIRTAALALDADAHLGVGGPHDPVAAVGARALNGVGVLAQHHREAPLLVQQAHLGAQRPRLGIVRVRCAARAAREKRIPKPKRKKRHTNLIRIRVFSLHSKQTNKQTKKTLFISCVYRETLNVEY